MSRRRAARWAVFGLCGIGLLPGACELITEPANNVLVNNNRVNVATGNGSAQVMFRGLIGQTIEITLSADSTASVPVGELIPPNGGGLVVPGVSTSVDGVNVDTVRLSQMGSYTLIVSDNAGIGGEIMVKVIVVSP